MMLTNPFSKIILGIFTLLPVMWMFYFMFKVFSQLSGDANSFNDENFVPLIKLHFANMGLVFILLVVYITHLFRASAVATDYKAAWAVVLFMGNVFSMPVYWYLYIWRKNA